MLKKIAFAALLLIIALTPTIGAMEESLPPFQAKNAPTESVIEIANQTGKIIRAFGEVEERLLGGNLGRLFTCFPGEETIITLPVFADEGTDILQSRLEIPGYRLKVRQKNGGYGAELRTIMEHGQTEPVSIIDFYSNKRKLVLIITREGTASLAVRNS